MEEKEQVKEKIKVVVDSIESEALLEFLLAYIKAMKKKEMPAQ